MKKNICHKNVLASLFVLSSITGVPFSRASAESFGLNCGNRTVRIQSLSLKNDSSLVRPGESCSVEQIAYSNIGVFCSGNSSYVNADCHSRNGRSVSNYSSFRMSMGSYGGEIAKSRLVISRNNEELIITVSEDYNTQFSCDTSVFIANNDSRTNCEIHPFTWSSGSGC